MNEKLIRELQLLLYAFGTGSMFAFLYDQIIVWRRLVKHAKLLTCTEDFFYLVFCFFISFKLLFYGNDGILRFYMIIGCALGILLYFTTIGRVYAKLMTRIIGFVMSPLKWLKKRLTRYLFQFTMKLRKCIASWKRKGETNADSRKKKKKQAEISAKKK